VGSPSVVLGLSGGIDSALTAALAADALGPAQVTGVAMPSRYSSQHSLDDAEALANNLRITYRVVPIDGMFQRYLDALDPVLPGALGVARRTSRRASAAPRSWRFRIRRARCCSRRATSPSSRLATARSTATCCGGSP